MLDRRYFEQVWAKLLKNMPKEIAFKIRHKALEGKRKHACLVGNDILRWSKSTQNQHKFS